MDRAGLLKQTKLSSSLSLSRQGKVKEPGLWLTKRVEGARGEEGREEITWTGSAGVVTPSSPSETPPPW